MPSSINGAISEGKPRPVSFTSDCLSCNTLPAASIPTVVGAMITLIDESVKSACVSDVDFVGSSSPYATFTSGVLAYFSGFSSNSFFIHSIHRF